MSNNFFFSTARWRLTKDFYSFNLTTDHIHTHVAYFDSFDRWIARPEINPTGMKRRRATCRADAAV